MKKPARTSVHIGDLPAFERTNYRRGQPLTADDMLVAQSYFNRKRWLLSRTVSGWGVVCGLDVVPQEGAEHRVTVTPGVAIDAWGREIVVPEAQEVSLTRDKEQCPDGPEDTPTGNRLLICLAFHECLTGPASHPDPKRVRNNRVRDGFQLWVEPEPGPAPSSATGHVQPESGRAQACSPHDLVCRRLKAGCPQCPDEPCLVLAEVTLPPREHGAVSIDACSRRKLVYSNPLLYDLITRPRNYIGTWLVLGPIFDSAHQVGGHSDRQDYDRGHPWAAEIIGSIDDNERHRAQLDPELLTDLGRRHVGKNLKVAPPRQGDQVLYGGTDRQGDRVFSERVYEWRKRSFSGVDWSNIHAIEDDIHCQLPGDYEDDPFDPRNNLNFSGKQHVLAFFLIYIPAPDDARTTKLHVRSDDSVRVWLNGEEQKALAHAGERDIGDCREYCTGITIKGRDTHSYNTLLIAVASTHVEWGLSARLEDDTGLRFSTERPDRLFAGQPACESGYRLVSIIGDTDEWSPKTHSRTLFCRGDRIWKGRATIHLDEQLKFVGFRAAGDGTDWWGRSGQNTGKGDNFGPFVAGVYEVTFDEDAPTHPTFILVKAFGGVQTPG